MQVNRLDYLHHKILVGRSQHGDVTEYENELHDKLRDGVKHKDPVVMDFIERINAQKPIVLTQSFLQKHRDKIIKYCEPAYNTLKLFIACGLIISVAVEVLYG